MRRRTWPAPAWLRAALPQSCVLCAAPSFDALLCGECVDDMPRIVGPCPSCALASPSGQTCGACLAKPPPQAATIAAWCYTFPADRLLHQLKYGGRLALAEPFADALTTAVRLSGNAMPDRIVPLPLGVARQRARGFNQAQEIGRRVGLRLDVPLIAPLRRRDTPPQTGLALDARARNVRHAFEAVVPLDGLDLAIVDDVMTTGATVAEAAATLRRAGARRVEAWVVARTPPPPARTSQNSLLPAA